MLLTTSKLHSLLFPSLIWNGENSKIYLTFDDGPHPDATLKVLGVLNKQNIKATFFLIGKNILKFPKIVENIVSEGHLIANHSFSHKRINSFSFSKLVTEINETDKLLRSFSNNKVNYFRPPFGFVTWNTKKAADKLNYKVCMWSLLSGDFYNWTNDKIINLVSSKTKKGSIIVFHDNEKTKNKISDILEKTIPLLKNKKFNFSQLSQI